MAESVSLAGVSPSGQRLAVLDSFRGLCAVLVALHHFKASGYIAASSFIQNSYLFVDFFFVLSGFVISARYFDELASGGSVRMFLTRRFWRIYPLHFAMLGAFFLIELFLMPLFAADRAPFSSPMTLVALIWNVLLLNSVNLTDGLTWNYPSWSIGAEALAYVAFAFAVASLRGKAIFLFVAAMGTGLGLLFLLSPDYIDATSDYGFLRCLSGFSVGVLVWRLRSTKTEVVAPPRSTWGSATLVELTCLSGAIVFVTLVGHNPMNLVSPILFGAVVYWFSLGGGAISAILRAKWLVFLGVISYSIYMVHALIASRLFSGGLQLVERYTPLQVLSRDGAGIFGATPIQGDILSLIYVGLVVTAATISYRWIELPGQNLFRQRTQTL